MYGQVKATLEPGVIQNIAEMQDADHWYDAITGKWKQRRASGLGETLETGIPYLGFNPQTNRQQVPLR
jgi:hypothetical protein